MGTPRGDQAQGTYLEVLAEIAGRVCYDSFGKGRSSKDFHKHIREVGHLSVYEHCVFTIEFAEWKDNWAEALLNRPGIYFMRQNGKARITINARALLEWDKYAQTLGSYHIKSQLLWHAADVMPVIFAKPKLKYVTTSQVSPIDESEIWVSVWLTGSRGFSHEMVRHGDNTAISQRSTRYVNESESGMCWHPSLTTHVNIDANEDVSLEISDRLARCTIDCKRAYSAVVQYLTDWKVDRKTAFGAARSILPNALRTQLVFSASMKQWKHIFDMRCSKFADAEIQEIMMDVRTEMRTSNEQY